MGVEPERGFDGTVQPTLIMRQLPAPVKGIDHPGPGNRILKWRPNLGCRVPFIAEHLENYQIPKLNGKAGYRHLFEDLILAIGIYLELEVCAFGICQGEWTLKRRAMSAYFLLKKPNPLAQPPGGIPSQKR